MAEREEKVKANYEEPLMRCRICGEMQIVHPTDNCKMFIPCLPISVEGLERWDS